MKHMPVLFHEVLASFQEMQHQPLRIFDGTFGRGGHTKGLLDAFPKAQIIACDWDHEAIQAGQENFSAEIKSGRLILVHDTFHNFHVLAKENENFRQPFHAMLVDLGVSSPQLDDGSRGFSFYHDGPLDMRMDQRRTMTAADVINEYEEEELIQIFKKLGEVRKPYRVVRAICHDRKIKPYSRTHELAGLIERVEGWRKKGAHPATQYFLALRLFVNDEISELEQSLIAFFAGLTDQGRMSLITFHSLEDRVVKQYFRSLEDIEKGFRVNRKVVVASDEEQHENPRSRSAKLRVFQKGVRDE